MPKHIDNAELAEPSAFGTSSGGSLARKYEYLVFYLFAISGWGLQIAAAVMGSLYGGQSKVFIGTVAPFLSCYSYVPYSGLAMRTLNLFGRTIMADRGIICSAAFLQTVWMMATAQRNTLADRMAYLNLACRFQRLCAVSAQQSLHH
jgi:hypothetical protein